MTAKTKAKQSWRSLFDRTLSIDDIARIVDVVQRMGSIL